MKLLEYKTEQAFDTLMEILAEVEKFTSNPEYTEFLEKRRNKDPKIDSNTFAKMLYGPEYRETTMKIMALADGKTIEDIKAMPYSKSHMVLLEILNNPEVRSFFTP